MLGVINLAFRDLDCVEIGSNPRCELKLYKTLKPGMGQLLELVELDWSKSNFLSLNHLRN